MSTKTTVLDSIQVKLMKFTQKMQTNIYIQSITEGMMGAMGVLIAGAICNLIVNLPISGWTDILTNLGIYDLLTMVVKIFECTAPMTSFLIGYALAKYKNVNQLQAGVMSYMCFLLTIPTLEDGTEAFAFTSLNGQTIATAMLTGLITTSIFAWITNKGAVIKMPDVVPEFVRNSLGNIPAGVLTALPFIVLRGVLAGTSYASFPGLINALISVPLSGLGNNIVGHCFFMFAANLVWWFGIHNMPILITAAIIMTPATAENTMAVASGLVAPNLLSWVSFLAAYQMLGGAGNSIGLCSDSMLFAKSERYKAQSKIQFVPGLFNITEPALFGMPIILNPEFFIPFVIAPEGILLGMYACLKAGLFTTPVISVNNFLPGPIVGFLMGGGIGLGIFMIVAVLYSCLVWYPFFKISDKRVLAEEQKIREAEAATITAE